MALTEDYIYITIPTRYIETYNRIAILLADYGEQMLKDCNVRCKDKTHDIIDCYNMFNAAIAANELGNTKLADTIIHYVNANLTQLYKRYKDTGDAPEPEPTPVETKYWYVGQITRTRPQFEELSAEQLVNSAKAYSVLQTTASFTINNSCWYCMIPEGEDIKSAKYTVNGITSTFTEQEIKNGFVTDVMHDDIEIDDITYKIYVNRNTALVASNAVASFTLKAR